ELEDEDDEDDEDDPEEASEKVDPLSESEGVDDVVYRGYGTYLAKLSGGGEGGVKRDEGGEMAMSGVNRGIAYKLLTDGIGELSGVGSPLESVVNLWHRTIRPLSSGMVIRF
ncbi:hypothetical protein GP486_008309, partial [Trichoglossum hirsutum]